MKKHTKALMVAVLLSLGGSGAFGQIPVGVTVSGDSLSARYTSWVAELNRQGEWYRCLCQSLRFGAGHTLPGDFAGFDGMKYYVEYLGANDRWLWDEVPGYQQMFASSFSARIAKATQKGYRILLILPPSLPSLGPHGPRNWLMLWYAVSVNYFGRTDIRILDPDDYDYEGNMDNTGHPLPAWDANVFAPAVHAEIMAWEAE